MEHFAKIVHYTYLRKVSFSRYLLYEINIMNVIKTRIIFTPQEFILYKKVWAPTLNFDIIVFEIRNTSFRLFVIQ